MGEYITPGQEFPSHRPVFWCGSLATSQPHSSTRIQDGELTATTKPPTTIYANPESVTYERVCELKTRMKWCTDLQQVYVHDCRKFYLKD